MRSARESDDRRLLGDLFDRFAVVPVDVGRQDLSRHEFDSVDIRALGKRAGEVEDILDLASGVGVSPELGIGPTDQPVDTDQRDVEASLVAHGSLQAFRQ